MNSSTEVFMALFLAIFLSASALCGMFSIFYLFKGDARKTEKKKKIISIATIIFIVFIFSYAAFYLSRPHYFLPSDEEWEEVYNSNEIIAGRLPEVLRHERRGIFYPMAISASSAVFGSHDGPYALNLFSLLATVVIIFFTGKSMTKSGFGGLVVASLFAMNPIVMVFMGKISGYPAFTSFLLSAFMACLYFAVAKKSIIGYIGSVSFAAMAASTKPEYGILFLLPLIAGIAQRKKLSFKKIIILAVVLLVSISSFAYKLNQLKEGDRFCGLVEAYSENNSSGPIVSAIDFVMRSIGGWRFSVDYLLKNIPQFFSFWLSPSFIPLIPFALYAVYVAFRKKYYWLLVPAGAFALISATYLADCAIYVTRYAIPASAAFCLLAGYGIYSAFDEGWRYAGKSRSMRIMVIAVSIAVVLGIVLFQAVEAGNRQYQDGIRVPTYMQSEIVIDHFAGKNGTLLMSNRDEVMHVIIDKKTTMSVVSLNDVFGRMDPNIPENICDKESLKCEGQVYFAETETCNIFPEVRNICDEVISRGIFEKTLEGRYPVKIYKIQ